MKLRDANLQVYEKNSFTDPPSRVLPSFSKNASGLILPKRLFESVRAQFFFRKYKRKVMLLVIYLFNYDSSKSVNLLHVECSIAFGVVLSTIFVK